MNANMAEIEFELDRRQKVILDLQERQRELERALDAILTHAPEDCGNVECDCLHYKTALADARALQAALRSAGSEKTPDEIWREESPEP